MCSDLRQTAFHTQPTRDLTKIGPEVMIENMSTDLLRHFGTFYQVLLQGLTREKPKGVFTIKEKDSTQFALVNIAATLLCERSERMGQLPLIKALLARDAGETKHGQERASIFKDQAGYGRTLAASHDLRDDPRQLLGVWRKQRESKMQAEIDLAIENSKIRLEAYKLTLGTVNPAPAAMVPVPALQLAPIAPLVLAGNVPSSLPQIRAGPLAEAAPAVSALRIVPALPVAPVLNAP
jgi:hypothetical protein